MSDGTKDGLRQLDRLLASTNQSWLLGAGISLNAGIPLMLSLTDHVFSEAEKAVSREQMQALKNVRSQLPKDSHIEHVLSQIGDYRAIADRSDDQNVRINESVLSVSELDSLHLQLLEWIAHTIRCGYRPKTDNDPEEIGTLNNRIVTVDDHLNFVSALFIRSQAGVVERRRAVKLFTTNYDTLLEDALALGGFSYWDGFSGGAVAYRSHRYGDEEPTRSYRAHVVKLHGSIDWHLGEDNRVWRVRDGDTYPGSTARVLIYPQSTKYLATQRDPFAAQFDLFRRTLNTCEDNILATCGYSFGDEHINQEIELALGRPENKTTLLAFASDINPILERWKNKSWGKRVYIITKRGLYVGDSEPPSHAIESNNLNWWTFDGVTKILNDGAEAFAQ